MKTSWIIGVMMLYLLIFGIEMMVTEGDAFNVTQQDQLTALMSPAMTNQSGVVSGAVAFVANIGTYFATFVSALFLWSPSVWTGYLIWFWLFFCLPISVGMIVGVVTILRGGASS